MERYRTARRQSSVDKILAAVVASGDKVLRRPQPGWAPLELSIQAPGGEHLDLVAYAFTANQATHNWIEVTANWRQVRWEWEASHPANSALTATC